MGLNVYHTRFLTAVFLISSPVFAQNIGVITRNPDVAALRKNQKVTGPVSRLIASSIYQTGYPNNDTIPSPVDSTSYTYTGPASTLVADIHHYANRSGFWYLGDTYKFTYDFAGKDTLRERQVYNQLTGNIVRIENYLTTYNSADDITAEVVLARDPASPSFTNQLKNSYTYNGSRGLLDKTWQRWDSATVTWINVGNYAYTVNARNSVLQQVTRLWSGTSSQWINYTRDAFNYDASGVHKTSMVHSGWNTVNSTWNYQNSDSLILDPSGRPISMLQLKWNSSTKSADTTWMHFYTYDAAGNLTDVNTQSWYPASRTFNNFKRVQYTYNSFNQVLMSTSSDWKGSVWTPRVYRYYYYEVYDDNQTGIKTSSVVDGITMRPNPATALVSVQIDWQDGQQFTATLIDMQGRIYHRFTGKAVKGYQTSLNMSNLPPGNYLLSINGEHGRRAAQILVVYH